MTSLILIVTLCFSLSSAGLIEISKISKIKKDAEDHFEIEFTGVTGTIHHYHLNILTGSGETQFQDNSVDAPKPTKTKATFKGNLVEFGSEVPAEFIITQRDDSDNEINYGDLPFTLPAFPSGVDSTWVGVLTDYSLRIAEKSTLAGFQLQDKGCTETETTSTICYFVDVKKNSAELCKIVVESPEVKVCDKTVAPDDVPATVANPDATELQYEAEGNSAKVIVTHPSSKTVSATEVIVYTEGDDSTVHASKDSTCSIGNIALQGDFKVVTVGIDGAPVDTGYQTLKDYGVVGTPLSQTLIETRWTHQGSDQYFVSIAATDGGSTGFTDTTVTCVKETIRDPPESDYHCFAYFTGLGGGKTYTLSVQIIGSNSAPIATNKITLTDTKTVEPEESEGMNLKISSLDTKWHKGLRSFEVNTCVNQAETSDLSTYEGILINNRGQWKKFTGATHRIGYELCFDALHLDIYNFDLSEDITLVVLKRGYDGITVLETAQTDISVGGNEIAAALRNSSSDTM